MTLLYNHTAPRFSALELSMVEHIPPGGNWKNIPVTVPSDRLAQIRESGGRTTYYGRLRWDKPAYTISTYFNRIGNGCHIHPDQNRLISIREGARLQSFPDKFRFLSSRGAQYKQVGNAVPPLLAKAVANSIRKHSQKKYFVDLFAGAGGMSEGFRMENFEPVGAIEIDKNYFQTYLHNTVKGNPDSFICGDICNETARKSVIDATSVFDVGLVIGGPPCQGFSLAGKRDSADPRNKLFEQFVKVVSMISPEYFVFENVPGIISMEHGEVIKGIIARFEEIGYVINGPNILKAENYGVPQKRRRVFLIGAKKKIELTRPYLAESQSITVKDAIYGLPMLTPGSGSEEIDVELNAFSEYQKFLMGHITANEFLAHSENKDK